MNPPVSILDGLEGEYSLAKLPSKSQPPQPSMSYSNYCPKFSTDRYYVFISPLLYTKPVGLIVGPEMHNHGLFKRSNTPVKIFSDSLNPNSEWVGIFTMFAFKNLAEDSHFSQLGSTRFHLLGCSKEPAY